ncbi:MAG: 50S ribosomal protein L18 [Anaerolineae bacterium]
MGKPNKVQLARKRRHQRVRQKVMGTSQRPRLNVYRSLNHIYAQIIDDSQGRTLLAVSTIDPSLRQSLEGKTKTEQAAVVGKALAQRATQAGITQVVFDRGGYKYHGRVKMLAEASREGGLQF